MHSLTDRELTAERMDDPVLDAGMHHRALQGLARINWWSRSVSTLWPHVEALARETSRPLRVLDVATGAGDVPVGLARRAARAGVVLELEGCDLSPTALAHATDRARRTGVAVRFFQHDVIRDPLPGEYDLVTCSLFLHHLTGDEAVTVLKCMRDAARRSLAVSDLLRSRSGYLLAWVGTRVLTRSRVVHFDGPVSVRAAFTHPEVRELAGQAGLT
jgi:2-polyprenyl-3-methyl-5-hydroxy-6-metoxy-1,4-benzoquinol methylase